MTTTKHPTPSKTRVKEERGELKMRPEQWLQTEDFLGIEILDPDGWDRRGDFDTDWNKTLTKKEMWGKINRSTVQHKQLSKVKVEGEREKLFEKIKELDNKFDLVNEDNGCHSLHELQWILVDFIIDWEQSHHSHLLSTLGRREEDVANLCHEQWSGWMKYLFEKCLYTQSGKLDGKGKAVIPISLVKRWLRQMNTKYENLPENEKESDRIEARKFIALLSSMDEK